MLTGKLNKNGSYINGKILLNIFNGAAVTQTTQDQVSSVQLVQRELYSWQ